MTPATSVHEEGSTPTGAATICPPGLTVLYDGSCPPVPSRDLGLQGGPCLAAPELQ